MLICKDCDDNAEGTICHTYCAKCKKFKKCFVVEICDVCGTQKFDRGQCSEKITCQDIKKIYNNGKPLNYYFKPKNI